MLKMLARLRALFAAGSRAAIKRSAWSAFAPELPDPAWLVRSSGWAPATVVGRRAR